MSNCKCPLEGVVPDLSFGFHFVSSRVDACHSPLPAQSTAKGKSFDVLSAYYRKD
jgi:hypothetical protein